MPDRSESSLTPRIPALGRALAVAVALFFVMVALGVVWVWKRAQREQTWREEVNASETFQAPRKPSPSPSPSP